MADLFQQEGIEPPKDIFAAEGIAPPLAPSVAERNERALSPMPVEDAPEEARKDYDSHRGEVERLARARFSGEQIEEMKAKGKIGFLEAYDFLDYQDILPGGGLFQAKDLYQINGAAEKMEKGEPLEESEQKLLNTFIDRYVESNLRGFSIGGGINYYGSQVPAFMVEFALTAGVGKAAQETTEQAVKKVVTKGITQKVVAKTIGATANIAARTAAMPQRYAPKYAELRLHDGVAITDRGEMLMRESKESPAKSAMKAFAYTGIEVASEMSGGLIGKYVTAPAVGTASRYLKTPIASGISRLPAKLRINLYTAYKAIQPNAQVSKVFTRAGWNGMINELGEERVADVMRATFDLSTDREYTMQDYVDAITPSSDQLLIEAGIIGITGGVKASADVATNILTEKLGGDRARAQETTDNMSATEQEDFVERSLTKPPDGFQDFVDLAKNSPDAESFIKASRNIKASADIQRYFGDRYKVADADMFDAARIFMEDVKNGVYDKADPISNAQQAAAAKQNPPNINDEESAFNRFYRDFVNSLQPIEDVTAEAQARGKKIQPGENPMTLSRTYAGVIGQIQHNLRYGTTKLNPETGKFEVDGKAMKQIMDDFDNSVAHIEVNVDAREQDFNDYLIARRILEDLVPRKDVEVTEADKIEAVETMNRLAAKYEQDMEFFKVFAEEMYEYQRRILTNLVDAGVLSKAKYDEILAKNPNYIPFQRVLDEKHFAGAVSSRGSFTNASANKVIKRIKGSDKEIKTPTHSVIANTAKIIDIAYRNRVAQGLADLADVMPEYIQKAPPIVVKRGTTKVKVTYDAGLRRKLLSAIKHFDNSFSQEKTMRAKGQGYLRGSYSPMEKMVRTRLGTNEGTLAHEVGHMLDYELGLMERMLADPKVKKELQELGRQRLTGDSVMTERGERLVFEDRVLDIEPQKYKDYVTSDREVIANLFDAYVNAPDMLKKIAPNAKKAFDKIVDEKPELAFIKEIKPSVERDEETIERDVWSPLDTAPKDTITVFRDGKKEFYKVSPALLDAMNNLSPVQMNATFRMLTSPFRLSARILRAGATLVPEFWIRNVIRDQSTALLQSPVRPTPIDMVKGLTAVIGKNELYQDWMKNGGSFNSYMELDDKGLEKAYKELFKPQGKFARYAKNPINVLADISMSLEQATRIGAFDKARRNGIVGIEAALLSREATLDFGRGGQVSRNINQYIPFFNAGVQAVDKMMRTMKQNPKATAFWGIATVTVPSVILTGYYLYGAPDDERREYLEIPQWQKDMFWVFKEGGQWRRIPKPFSFGYLFGSVPERFMTWAYEGDKPEVRDFWKELALGVAGTISPVYDPSAVLPPLVKVAIEDLTNYNFFTGRNIYPEWMDRYEPEKRSNKYTSETAKKVGEWLGVSPALLDNSLRGQLAGAGTYVTDAGDGLLKAVKKWNGETVPDEPVTDADVPVIKAFAVREPTGYGTNSVSNFFDDWERVNEVHATFNSLEGEEKIAYREKNEALLRAYKPMKNFYDRIRKFGKESDRIYNDEAMSSQEKVDAMSDHGEQILDTAISANKWYKENVKGD